MCSRNIHNCSLLLTECLALKNINYKSQCHESLFIAERKKFILDPLSSWHLFISIKKNNNSTQISSPTQLPSHTYLIKNVFTGFFFFFNHQASCKWILFQGNFITNIIFIVKLLTSKSLPSSKANNWFYPSSVKYIVIHWMSEDTESIKCNWDNVKRTQALIWKSSHIGAMQTSKKK